MLVASLRTLVLSCWCVGTRLVLTSHSSVHMPTWTPPDVSLGCLALRTLLSSGRLSVSAMLSCLTGTSSSTMLTGRVSLSWGQWKTLTPLTYSFNHTGCSDSGSLPSQLLCSYSLPFCLLLCVRPLWVEYPKDTATFTIDDEFLIGEIQTSYICINIVLREILRILFIYYNLIQVKICWSTLSLRKGHEESQPTCLDLGRCAARAVLRIHCSLNSPGLENICEAFVYGFLSLKYPYLIIVSLQVWYDVHTFQKHSGAQNLYIPVTMSSVCISLTRILVIFE